MNFAPRVGGEGFKWVLSLPGCYPRRAAISLELHHVSLKLKELVVEEHVSRVREVRAKLRGKELRVD